ncbi:MAG: glycerol kinase GlpK [Paracoccus sp. (in: a-proteobacteria)]|nr:glycerol kinase GlpK [Paracoccus sp. (in: a-proteobacteria)]
MTHILAIDQGTTSSRAILFDADMTVRASAQEEFPQHFPRSGWVEHDPEDLWATVAGTCRAAIEKAGNPSIAAIGITNQRETVLVWDRKTGKPIHNAIVWQDRRTADFCRALEAEGHGDMITARTGLLVDPYFSATKLKWLLDNVEGARTRAEAGELAFGTVDSWLIWRLTGGKTHATDATNAARTMLYDIHKGRWSRTICDLFGIPQSMLPDVRDCSADFGTTRPDLFGRPIPITGVAGDQQAATLGQACFQPGMMKSTYGTGCFALLNTGATPVKSTKRLLTTIAYQLDGTPTYALEGSIFIAGAVVQWLRDGLKIIREAAETQPLAESADDGQRVILVPAFTGLGAPYWKPDCRGAIFGLTRNSGPAELARAALESVGYQTRDLLEAMRADWQAGTVGGATALRVDGGMAASDWTMQFLSDIIGAQVDRPRITETTALGAAWLAGQGQGVYPDAAGFARSWALERSFTPAMPEYLRSERYDDWQRALRATIGFCS